VPEWDGFEMLRTIRGIEGMAAMEIAVAFPLISRCCTSRPRLMFSKPWPSALRAVSLAPHAPERLRLATGMVAAQLLPGLVQLRQAQRRLATGPIAPEALHH